MTEPAACSIVVPNWNGRRWLPGCLTSLAEQTAPPLEVLVVDNGSTDGSLDYIRSAHPGVRILELGRNTGFAHAANCGIEAARGEYVGLVNADVVLSEGWVQRMTSVLAADPQLGSAACKMLSLDDPTRVYDAGDQLRRDGVCEQHGRFESDHPRFDRPAEVFGACAGAALYRRSAVLALGGFDRRYFAYLEDVDLALRLRLTGWGCRYEPVVALHAGEQSSRRLAGGHWFLVQRNTLVLVTKAFPVRWLPLVAYRQLSWAWHALRERRLRWQLRGWRAALPLIPAALRDRRRIRAEARVPIELVVPARPFRGPRAEGHPSRFAAGSRRA